MLKIIVNKNDSGQTIIKFLKKIIDLKSKVNIYKLFRTKDIKVNNKVEKDPKFIINENDEILIFSNDIILKEQRDVIKKTNLVPVVYYEDENILIVLKEHGLLIHNVYGESLDNVVKNYLIDKKEYDPQTTQSFVISHIHRLDKLTKGLVIYAKNKKTLDLLLKRINDKKYINKFYLLKCEGAIKEKSFSISGYIYQDSEIEKMVFTEQNVDKYSKNCQTNFKLLEVGKDNNSILEAELITGRKNQIRASLEFYQHPIINDYKYGGNKIINNKKILLFAYKIIFNNFEGHLSYLNNKIISMDVDFRI